MKINKKSIPGFDDILFASRNREYGAYQLRKKYNSVVIGGIIFASVIGSAAVILPFVLNPPSEHIISGGRGYVRVTMENLKPPDEEIYIPPVPPPPESKKIMETVKYVPPEVVDTVVPVNKSLLSNDEILANYSDNQTKTNTAGSGNELLSGDIGSGDGDAFFLVEIMPTFRGGGLDKFRDWVQKRTNYPQEAVDKKIKGKVVLSFIVEKDGSVSNVIVVKSVNPLLDNEALKTISESPKWTPGLQRGQPVRIRYLIPVDFFF
ncbi:MAG: energy transducer TonB [Bacteroidales bacterium]